MDTVGTVQQGLADLNKRADTHTETVNKRLYLSFRTSRALFLPPPLGVVSGLDREGFEFAHEGV